jgi:membrane associated rhomboid family serine protease
MQFPWRPLRKPPRHHAGSWPPTATQWLLGVTALSLLTQLFLRSDAVANTLLRTYAELSPAGLAAGHFWQPVTYLFLSGGAWLDFAALLALYLAGSNLEFIIGRRHLVQLYFLAGILGGLGQFAYNMTTAQAVPALVGPTSAVMGVFLGLTSVMPNLELAPLLGFPLPFWLKIKHCALAAVVGCAVVALVDPNGAFAREQAARCLIGCLTGCVYMRQLGFGRRVRARGDSPEHEPMLQIPVFSQAAEIPKSEGAEAARPRFTERERRMTPRQYISEQIDPILDKISLHGIGCLTAAERRVLEKGRDKISQRDV